MQYLKIKKIVKNDKNKSKNFFSKSSAFLFYEKIEKSIQNFMLIF